MLTNPNTLGLYESAMPSLTRLVHDKGGLVYGDGANMNAVLGRARPGDIGVDVMQYNLHKTFTTPHGGGGPGCGPVGYKKILDPYAPVPVSERNEDGTYRLDYGSRPKSIGRVRSFHTNFGMAVIREHLATKGNEFGATTGRQRRCGWFDAVVLRRFLKTHPNICLNIFN